MIHGDLDLMTLFAFGFGVTKFNLAFLLSTLGLRPDGVDLFVKHFDVSAEIHIRVVAVQFNTLDVVVVGVDGPVLGRCQNLLLLGLGQSH